MKNTGDQRRRKQSERIENSARELRAMREELRRLWKVRWEAPLLPLEKPFQRGWTRFFVLRKDALRRKDANELRQALECVQCREYCRKGDFLSYDWKSRRYYDRGHHLRRFSAKGLLALRMDDTVLAQFRHQHRGSFGGRRDLRELVAISWGGRFVFRYPEYCVSVIEPYWITHVRVHYPEVESRIAEIENRIDHLGGWHVIYPRSRGCRAWDRLERNRRRDRLLDRDTRDEILDWEVSIRLSTTKGAERSAPFSLECAGQGSGATADGALDVAGRSGRRGLGSRQSTHPPSVSKAVSALRLATALHIPDFAPHPIRDYTGACGSRKKVGNMPDRTRA